MLFNKRIKKTYNYSQLNDETYNNLLLLLATMRKGYHYSLERYFYINDNSRPDINPKYYAVIYSR